MEHASPSDSNAESPATASGPIAPPTERFSGPALPAIASDDVVCMQCGYQLRGMPSDRHCPECGTPVSRSMRGNLLIFSAPDYLRSMHRGLNCILLAAMLNFVIGIVSAVGGIVVVALVAAGQAAGGAPGAMNPVMVNKLQLWMSAATLPAAALSLLGWWLFSAPDPAVTIGQNGQQSRLIIRITVIIVAIASALSFAFIAKATFDPAAAILAGAAGFISGIASLVQFFASMLYVKWLAPRLPDLELVTKSVLYMWLLPVIFVVGTCLIIGPLVAQIMYLLLLNRIRVRLRIIRERQSVDFPVAVA